MPLYDFECASCGTLTEHQCKIAERLGRADCSACGKKASCEITSGVSAPLIGTGRRRGDSRIIHSERQVTDELGVNWRDEGTTGKEGGAGKKLYGHG